MKSILKNPFQYSIAFSTDSFTLIPVYSTIDMGRNKHHNVIKNLMLTVIHQKGGTKSFFLQRTVKQRKEKKMGRDGENEGKKECFSKKIVGERNIARKCLSSQLCVIVFQTCTLSVHKQAQHSCLKHYLVRSTSEQQLVH